MPFMFPFTFELPLHARLCRGRARAADKHSCVAQVQARSCRKGDVQVHA